MPPQTPRPRVTSSLGQAAEPMAVVRRHASPVHVEQPGEAIQDEARVGGGEGEGVPLQRQGPEPGQRGERVHQDQLLHKPRPAQVQRHKLRPERRRRTIGMSSGPPGS